VSLAFLIVSQSDLLPMITATSGRGEVEDFGLRIADFGSGNFGLRIADFGLLGLLTEVDFAGFTFFLVAIDTCRQFCN
jgi:hypothetical protein